MINWVLGSGHVNFVGRMTFHRAVHNSTKLHRAFSQFINMSRQAMIISTFRHLVHVEKWNLRSWQYKSPTSLGRYTVLYLNNICELQYMCMTLSYAVMVTALNKAGQAVGTAISFSTVCVWGEQVLMTHIHDRYIIRVILVQGFSSFQTACLHDHHSICIRSDCRLHYQYQSTSFLS